MAASFAGHAAVAMELARARADQVLLAQAEDHDRIAGDLHDQVIGELFALGMRLQGQAALSDPAAADRVTGYVDTLDEVIRNIRASIFGLRQPRQPRAGLQARIMEVIDEHAAQLGFTADASLTLPAGPDPDETLAHDILAVTREALSNCARHAHATAVTITLARQDGLITLDITDNGRGLGTHARIQRPGQHPPPRRKQRRDPPDHHPRRWRHPPSPGPPADFCSRHGRNEASASTARSA